MSCIQSLSIKFVYEGHIIIIFNTCKFRTNKLKAYSSSQPSRVLESCMGSRFLSLTVHTAHDKKLDGACRARLVILDLCMNLIAHCSKRMTIKQTEMTENPKVM